MSLLTKYSSLTLLRISFRLPEAELFVTNYESNRPRPLQNIPILPSLSNLLMFYFILLFLRELRVLRGEFFPFLRRSIRHPNSAFRLSD